MITLFLVRISLHVRLWVQTVRIKCKVASNPGQVRASVFNSLVLLLQIKQEKLIRNTNFPNEIKAY